MNYTVASLRKKLNETFLHVDSDVMKVSIDKCIENEIGFFPYGSGLLTGKKDLPQNGIMVLGQDFGTEEYLTEDVLKNGEIKSKTYVNFKTIIPSGKEDKVFLTNLFIGLRKTGKMSGKNPAFFKKNRKGNYLELCFSFFEEQLKFTNPTKIIVLGKVPYCALLQKYGKNDFTKFADFDYSSDKTIIVNEKSYKIAPIQHPSMWNSNLKKSKKDLIKIVFE